MLGKVLFDKQVYNSEFGYDCNAEFKINYYFVSYIIITDLYVFYSTHSSDIYKIYHSLNEYNKSSFFPPKKI